MFRLVGYQMVKFQFITTLRQDLSQEQLVLLRFMVLKKALLHIQLITQQLFNLQADLINILFLDNNNLLFSYLKVILIFLIIHQDILLDFQQIAETQVLTQQELQQFHQQEFKLLWHQVHLLFTTIALHIQAWVVKQTHQFRNQII